MNSYKHDPDSRKVILSKISEVEREIQTLEKDIVTKYKLAGEIGYDELSDGYEGLTQELKNKLGVILELDAEIINVQQRIGEENKVEKKGGFFSKLKDGASSVAKQGKLKIDELNLERKKKKAIADFGSKLWDEHNTNSFTLDKLSGVFREIVQLENEINKCKKELMKLRELIE